MACTRIGYLLSRFLYDQLDKNKVRVQDSLSGLRAVAIRPEGYLKTWLFVKDNWNELFSRLANILYFFVACIKNGFFFEVTEQH